MTVKELLEFIRRYKDIEVVINSAGFGKMGYMHEIKEKDEVDMINTNITALHMINKYFATYMKKGIIVNISSIAGIAPTPYMSQYGATKAYVYSLSRALNYEMKKLKIVLSIILILVIIAGGYVGNMLGVFNEGNYGEYSLKDTHLQL